MGEEVRKFEKIEPMKGLELYAKKTVYIPASRRLGYSSRMTLIQPAMGMAMMAPTRPNIYIPMTMAVRTRAVGRFRASPWSFGAIKLFSICS